MNIKTYYGNESLSYKYEAYPGIYKIECWGGKGRDWSENSGGKGGYVSGYIKFYHFLNLYVYPGGIGNKGEKDVVFNGGGRSQYNGGGASDVRLIGGDWNNLESLISRIIVAGGGGGSDADHNNVADIAGSAGGIQGYSSQSGDGKGGNQTHGGDGNNPGSFGQGGSNTRYDGSGNGAGGGGYFGGSASNDSGFNSGGGGSSFISGYPGCIAVDPSSTDPYNMKMLKNEVHYSGYKFFLSEMKDGRSQMPSPDGHSYENGHSSYGVVKITFLSKIQNISCSKSTFTNSFIYIMILIII